MKRSVGPVQAAWKWVLTGTMQSEPENERKIQILTPIASMWFNRELYDVLTTNSNQTLKKCFSCIANDVVTFSIRYNCLQRRRIFVRTRTH